MKHNMRIVPYLKLASFLLANLAIIFFYNTNKRQAVIGVNAQEKSLMKYKQIKSNNFEDNMKSDPSYEPTTRTKTTSTETNSQPERKMSSESPSLLSSCPVGSVDSGVLAAVMSAPANWRRRDLLRRTWARDNRITTRSGQ